MIQPHSGGDPLRLGTAQLDRVSQVASCGGRTIVLTVLEARLLTLLGEAEGRLLTRAEILEFVWNDTSDVRTRVVDVHVAALRKKLAQVNAPLEIVSVRGIGYRLDTK
jgi:two-component system, OmpR family, response regulator